MSMRVARLQVQVQATPRAHSNLTPRAQNRYTRLAPASGLLLDKSQFPRGKLRVKDKSETMSEDGSTVVGI